ncbi:hypothetical protein [Streptomyces sp. JW3]|uniref:hypothetical protein n=1 Tax=Streptomyces sp. JW3 TaxID=3456955 RepID=UPI003FA429E1
MTGPCSYPVTLLRQAAGVLDEYIHRWAALQAYWRELPAPGGGLVAAAAGTDSSVPRHAPHEGVLHSKRPPTDPLPQLARAETRTSSTPNWPKP